MNAMNSTNISFEILGTASILHLVAIAVDR